MLSRLGGVAAFCFVIITMAGTDGHAQQHNPSAELRQPIPPPPLELSRIGTWPRATLTEFGCLLERDGNHRDPHFNCSLTTYEYGDACKPDTRLYDGPQIPPRLAEKHWPDLVAIDLAWEHGDLQAVSLRARQPQSYAWWIKTIGIKSDEDKPPANRQPPRAGGRWQSQIMYFDLDDCVMRDGATMCRSLSLQGFDHMGKGDYECPEEK